MALKCLPMAASQTMVNRLKSFNGDINSTVNSKTNLFLFRKEADEKSD
jgi:hypothetical protein